MVVELSAAVSPPGDTAANPQKKRGGGPQTPEGRRAASFNAFKHGFRAKVALPAELAARVELYRKALTAELAPRTELERWLVEQMARAMAQLDRFWELSLVNTQRCVNVAQFDWVAHRRTLVENLGSRLTSQPARVAYALEQTEHGALWKIDRWQGIRAVLETTGTCEEDLHSLIFDLMGVPPVLRAGNYKVPPAAEITALRTLARNEIDRLTELCDTELVDREEFLRSLAASGMPCDEDAETARLRRYEAMCRRELKWARAQFDKGRNESAATDDRSASRLAAVPESRLTHQVERPLPVRLPAQAAGDPAPRLDVPSTAFLDVEIPETEELEENMSQKNPSAGSMPPARPASPLPAAPGAPVSARNLLLPSPRLATSAHRVAAPRNRRERRAAEARARKAKAHQS